MPKASTINLLDFRTPPMRTFHITWITFFACFFGWFGIAPLMPVVREDLELTQAQIGNIIIASVSITMPSSVLIIASASAPAATHACATSTMSVTSGDSLAMTGTPGRCCGARAR